MVDIAHAPAGARITSGVRRPWWTRLSRPHLLALAAGVLAGALNLAALERAQAGVLVLAAIEQLPADRPLRAAVLEPVTVRMDAQALRWLVPAHELAGIEGSLLRHPLRAGEPLRWSDLRRAANDGGRKSMSLPVDPHHAVAGSLRPGDIVDVAVVRDGAAAWVLTAVEVVDVDDGDGGVTVLTLDLDAEQALRLAVALREGDVDVVRTSGARPAAEPRA